MTVLVDHHCIVALQCWSLAINCEYQEACNLLVVMMMMTMMIMVLVLMMMIVMHQQVVGRLTI